jgi:hypothetical protein
MIIIRLRRMTPVRRRSLEMKVDPEQHQGPEQDRQSRRSDRFHRIEMLEVVMGRCDDDADDEIDQAEYEADEAAQKIPLSS